MALSTVLIKAAIKSRMISAKQRIEIRIISTHKVMLSREYKQLQTRFMILMSKVECWKALPRQLMTRWCILMIKQVLDNRLIILNSTLKRNRFLTTISNIMQHMIRHQQILIRWLATWRLILGIAQPIFWKMVRRGANRNQLNFDHC